ncbi:hypothetical protein AWB82_02144 [Caballeronia glebae]|uniref:Uncharacterized protein n=1 Tax=Caballeronia glebae TaxID=1777143 RepID=A0A158ADM1_9BURK|nr:hypothetical protein AWB82_02144 [Caballeronia glebae]
MRNFKSTGATAQVRIEQRRVRRIRESSLNWSSSTVEQKVVTPGAPAPGVFFALRASQSDKA